MPTNTVCIWAKFDGLGSCAHAVINQHHISPLSCCQVTTYNLALFLMRNTIQVTSLVNRLFILYNVVDRSSSSKAPREKPVHKIQQQ